MLRAVQVGLGVWGRDWAARVIPEVPQVDVAGYIDPDPDAMALARKMAGIPTERCFSTLEQAFEATRPDAVLVTTSLNAHVPIIRAALEAGKHVLVEKPFAPSGAEARDVVELARVQDVVLMVSQNYRFFPAARAVTGLVRDRELGEVREVAIDFRRPPTAGGGRRGGHHGFAQPLLVDMAIHHFDLLRLVLGGEAQEVFCRVWNPSGSGFDGPPAGAAIIEFDRGVVVSYRGSWISRGPTTPWAGEWRMELEGGEIAWTSRGPVGDDSADRVEVRPLGEAAREIELPRLSHIDRAGTLVEFAAAVEAGREPECSGRENLGSVALMEAAVESATAGRPVGLDLE